MTQKTKDNISAAVVIAIFAIGEFTLGYLCGRSDEKEKRRKEIPETVVEKRELKRDQLWKLDYIKKYADKIRTIARTHYDESDLTEWKEWMDIGTNAGVIISYADDVYTEAP